MLNFVETQLKLGSLHEVDRLILIAFRNLVQDSAKLKDGFDYSVPQIREEKRDG